jgi:hypothetical protein
MRHSRSLAAIAVALLALCLFSPGAFATQTCCVGTLAEFQNALDQAEIDNDDSRIDVRAFE